jgi:hypothetical protein
MNRSPFDTPSNPQAKAPASGGLRLAPFWKRSMEEATAEGAGEPFDALADLFLGEIGPREAAKRGPQAVAPVTEDAPKLRLAGSGEGPVEMPVMRAASPEAIETRPAAPVLKMAGEEDGEAKEVAVMLPPPVRNPVMECVVLANLPVMGSAWASQYVREIASAAGKMVASLRVEGDFVRLELVGVAPEGVTLPAMEEVSTLEAAIDAAAEVTDRWVVRCDAGEEGVVAACGMTRVVTVLSGVDPMAREACRPVFERLKGAFGDAGDAGPMLRLALMGAGGEEANEVGAGLATVAEQTIGRGVTPVVCASKIGAGKTPHMLFGGASELGLKGMLGLVEKAVGVGGVKRDVVEAAPRRVEAAREEMRAAVERDVEVVEEGSPFSPAAAAVVPGRVVEEPVEVERETRFVAAAGRDYSTTGRQAASATHPETGRAASVTRSEAPHVRTLLASHVAELKPVAMRCPYAEGIELAVDAEGTLHLLGRSGSDGGDESVLAALMVASSWAEAHAAIIAATGQGVRESVRPTLHLFTDRPKRSRRLLDTALRVHLLAPVTVGGQTAWYCAELN